MPVIKLELPDKTPLSALRELAESQGCDLRLSQDGTYRAVPRYPSKVVDFNTNPFSKPFPAA